MLLHGWMDCAASFQFLVDAFARERHVVAPDLRGFGGSAWQPDGYWFLDYVADLDALVDTLAPAGAIDLVGHSLGGNVAMLYGGVRPARVRRLVSLEGFGIPDEPSSRAPDKVTAWLDALRKPPGFAPYASLAAVADRLQKNDPRLARDRALWLAPHWARARGRRLGDARLRSAAQAAVPDGLSLRRHRRGLDAHRGARPLGRRRRVHDPALARGPAGRRRRGRRPRRGARAHGGRCPARGSR